MFCQAGKGPEATLSLLETHWQELLLHYLGLVTAAGAGILLALLLPVTGDVRYYRIPFGSLVLQRLLQS